MSVCNICDQLVTRVKPIGIELQSVLEKLENEPKNNSDHAAAEPPQWICNKCELKARNRYILKFQQESSSEILQMQLENEKLKNMINQLQQGGIKISILTGSQDIKDTADIKNAATGTSQKNSMLLGNIVSAMGAVITRDLQNSKSEHKLANSTQLNSENNNMMVEQACSSNTKSQLQLVTNENSLQQPSTTSSTKIICQSKYIITNPDPAIHELSKEQKSNEYILPTNYVPLPTDQENLQNIVEFKTEPDDSMEFLNDTKSLNALQNINSIVTVPEMHNTELDFATEDACNEFNSLSRLSNTESIQKLEAKDDDDDDDDDELSDESQNKKQSSVEYKNFYRQAANMYYCRLCKKKFKYYGGVVYHINTYHLELKYKCNECSAIYTAYHDMRQHYEVQHKLKQIPLPKEMTIMMLPSSSKAGKTINNRHSFQALIRKSGKLYFCNKCSESEKSYTSKYYETVRRHVKACHVEACLEQQQKKENTAINQRTAADRTARKRIRKRVRALWRKSGNLYLCNTCALNGRPYTCKHIETIRRHIKACHLDDDDEMELQQKQNTTSGPVSSSSNITIKQEQQRTAAEFVAKDISAIKEENLLTECKFDKQQNSVLTEPEFIAEDISNATIAVDDIIKEENQLTEYSFDEQQYNMPTETEIEFEFSSMTASEQKQSCSSLLKQKTAATNENNDGDLTVQEAEQFSTEPSRRLLQLQSLLQKNILNKKRAASLSYHKFYRRGANSYYNCVLCKTSQNYSHRSGIIEHIKSMHIGVKYKCNECNEMYANFTGLRCHYKNKHKNKQIPLPKEITIMVLPSSSSLKTISQKKYNLKKLIRKSGDDYVCSICAKDGTSYTRKYYESVRRHIKTCHRKAFLENELTAYRIDEQQNSVLTDNTIENVNELSLNKTQQSRSKRKKPINYSEFYRNVANNYYCVICKPSKKYSTCCGVIYHLKTVHFGVKYKCHECSVIYMAYHDIRQHYQRQHKTKPTPSPKQLTIIDMPCCSNKRNTGLLRKCGNLYICNECTLNGKYYTNKCYDTTRDHLKACHLKAYLEQQQQINKLLQKQNATIGSVSSSIAISQEQQHAAAELIAEDIMAATDVVNDLVKEENHLTEYRFDEQNMNVVTAVTADCNEFPPLTNDRSESERFEHYQDIQPVQESIIAAKSLHNRKQIKPSIYMSSYKKYICSMCSPDEVTIKYSFRSDIIKHMKAAHSKRLNALKTNNAEAVQKSRKHAAKIAENDAAAVKIRKINKTEAAKTAKNNVAAVKLQMRGGTDQNGNSNANAVKQMHKNATKKFKNCRKQKVGKNTDKPLCADDAVLLSECNTFKPESNDDIAKVQEISVFIKEEKQFNDGYEFPAEVDKNVAGLHKDECSIVSSGSIKDQLSKCNQYFLQNSSSSERNVLQYPIIEDAEVQLTENAELPLTENDEVPLTKDVANLLTDDIKEFQFIASPTVCAFTNLIFQDYVANYEEIDGKYYIILYLCILCSGAGTNHFLYNKQNLLMHLKEKHFHDTTKSIKKNNAVLREQIALSIKRLGRKYICTLCPTNDEKQQFTSFEYEAVTRHVLYGHWQKHQCQHCEEIFSSKSNLKLQHEQKVPCTLENNYSQAIKDNQNFSVTSNYETATAENVSAIGEDNKQLVNESSSSMLNAMISNRIIVSSKFVSEKGALLSDSTSHKCQGCARVFAKNGFLLRHQMTCKLPRKLSPTATGYRKEQAKNINNSSTEYNHTISEAKRQTLNSTEYNATQIDNWISSNLSEMSSPTQIEKGQLLNDSNDCASSSSLLRIHNSTTFNSTNKCRYCCRVISRGLQRHENTCILALTDRQLMEKHITR